MLRTTLIAIMALFDIRVLHPGAKSNANHNIPAKMYSKHEREKERKYIYSFNTFNTTI